MVENKGTRTSFHWADKTRRLCKANDLFIPAGKDNSPAASLHIKPKDPKKFNTPAPGIGYSLFTLASDKGYS